MPKVISAPVTPWQAEYIAYTGKTGGVIGGVGSGKTFINSDWVVTRAGEYPRSASAIIAATRKQLKEGTLVTFAGRLDDLGIKYRQNLTDLSTTLLNGPMRGHRIQAYSVENRAYRRLKALEFDTVWCDELQIWEAGRPALDYIYTRNRSSPFVATCVERVRRANVLGLTPNPRDVHYAAMQPQLRFSANPPWSTAHWLHTTFIDPQDEEGNPVEAARDDLGNEVRVWRVSTLDNTLLPRRDEYIANLRKRLPEDVFAVEVLGESRDIGVGRAYTQFFRLRATQPVKELPWTVVRSGRVEIDFAKNRPLAWLHDFGVNPRVWLVAQIHVLAKPIAGYQRILIYVLDEATIFNGDTVQAIGTFVERYPVKDWPRIYAYGDASGKNPNSVTGQSDWGQIQSDKRLSGYRLSIHKRPGNPPVVDRIFSVNTKLCNADDEIGVLIHPRCRRLLADLQQTRWVEGQRKLDHGSRQKELFFTHWSDALGYFIEREWPVHISKGIRKIGEGTTVR